MQKNAPQKRFAYKRVALYKKHKYTTKFRMGGGKFLAVLFNRKSSLNNWDNIKTIELNILYYARKRRNIC